MGRQNNNLMSGSASSGLYFSEGRVVYLNGSVLQYAAGRTSLPAGVLAQDAPYGGYGVVFNGGESILMDASGSIAADQHVMASADGDGKVCALSGSGSYPIGKAESAASGGKVYVKVNLLPPTA